MEVSEKLVEDAVEVLGASSWYEAQLHCEPESLYRCLAAQAPGAVLMFHHFYEPWHPTGAVARLMVADDRREEVLGLLGRWETVVAVEPWRRESHDRKLFGDDFQYAMAFFMGSSVLASHERGEQMTTKLIHCVLNARRMSRSQEFRWALRFAWRSATVEPRLWFRALRSGRKWWDQ